MNDRKKYDPEDLNKLLETKSYDQLLQEEKLFVQDHVSSPEEYMKMRSLMLDLDEQQWDSTPDPNPRIKEFLVRKHKEERKGSMKIWLNGLFGFATPETSWYQKPAFQLALASGLILITVVGLLQINTERNTLAMNKDEATEKEVITSPSSPKQQNIKSDLRHDSTAIELDLDESIPRNESITTELNAGVNKDKLDATEKINTAPLFTANDATSNTLNAEVEEVEIQAEETTVVEVFDVTDTDVIEMEESISPSVSLGNQDLSGTMIIEERSSKEDDIDNISDDYDKGYSDLEMADEIEYEERINYPLEEPEKDIASVAAESLQEISTTSNRRAFKKKEESKVSSPMSISLAEQGNIIDQLFEAY